MAQMHFSESFPIIMMVCQKPDSLVVTQHTDSILTFSEGIEISFIKCKHFCQVHTFLLRDAPILPLLENLLFFAAYVIYKKNYSFSRVVFLFFQTKIANSFYSKINDSGRLWTTRFSSSRFGVRVTALPNFFTIYP